jgi:hypothetical protein
VKKLLVRGYNHGIENTQSFKVRPPPYKPCENHLLDSLSGAKIGNKQNLKKTYLHGVAELQRNTTVSPYPMRGHQYASYYVVEEPFTTRITSWLQLGLYDAQS